MTTNAMPVSSGRWLNSSDKASSPPAEAPTPTIVGQMLSARFSSASRGTATAEPREYGPLWAVCFANRHHYLSQNLRNGARGVPTLSGGFAQCLILAVGGQPTDKFSAINWPWRRAADP